MKKKIIIWLMFTICLLFAQKIYYEKKIDSLQGIYNHEYGDGLKLGVPPDRGTKTKEEMQSDIRKKRSEKNYVIVFTGLMGVFGAAYIVIREKVR